MGRSKAEPGIAGFLLNPFLHVKYFTAIGRLPVSLYLISVGNQHIFLKRNVIDIYKNAKFHDFFMTFCQIFIFHDFSSPGFYFFHFPWFSMIFHDRGNPVLMEIRESWDNLSIVDF